MLNVYPEDQTRNKTQNWKIFYHSPVSLLSLITLSNYKIGRCFVFNQQIHILQDMHSHRVSSQCILDMKQIFTWQHRMILMHNRFCPEIGWRNENCIKQAVLEGHAQESLGLSPAQCFGTPQGKPSGLLMDGSEKQRAKKPFLLVFLPRGYFLSDVLTKAVPWLWLLPSQSPSLGLFSSVLIYFSSPPLFQVFTKASRGLSLYQVPRDYRRNRVQASDTVGTIDNIPGTQVRPWDPQSLSWWLNYYHHPSSPAPESLGSLSCYFGLRSVSLSYFPLHKKSPSHQHKHGLLALSEIAPMLPQPAQSERCQIFTSQSVGENVGSVQFCG